MDIQVRDCVYETNSSSSHSLSISDDNIFDMNFSQRALRSGVIKLVVPVDEDGDAVHFENEWRRFYTPENILLYVLLVAAGGKITANVPEVDVLPTLTHNYKRVRDLASAPKSRYRKRLRDLLVWFKQETGCRVELSFPVSACVSAPAPRSICIGSDQASRAEWLLKDQVALKSLIFSSNSYVETGYDNEQPPYFIPTDDHGIETYFADRIVERTDLGAWFTLTASEDRTLTYEDKDGEIVSRDGCRMFDLYYLVQVAAPVNLHLLGCDFVLPVYVSSWPEGMEEFDVDLQVKNEDRLLNLMNGFVSYAVAVNVRSGEAARITMQPGLVPALVEKGTSNRTPHMPHECKQFKIRIACDEETRLKVRAKAASMLTDQAA